MRLLPFQSASLADFDDSRAGKVVFPAMIRIAGTKVSAQRLDTIQSKQKSSTMACSLSLGMTY